MEETEGNKKLRGKEPRGKWRRLRGRWKDGWSGKGGGKEGGRHDIIRKMRDGIRRVQEEMEGDKRERKEGKERAVQDTKEGNSGRRNTST